MIAAAPATAPRPLDAIPGPRGLPLVGSFLTAQRDPLALFVDAMRTHGPVVRFRFGPYDYVALADADGVRRFLVDNVRNYPKSPTYEGLRLVVGDGILTSEGEPWRRNRRLIAPSFHRERIAGFVGAMWRDTEALVDEWLGGAGALGREPGLAPAVRDVHADMMALTLRIVGRTLFGVDLAREARGVAEALEYVIPFANDYGTNLLRLPTWVPSPGNLRFRAEMRELDALVAGIIAERRGRPGDDVITMLLEARDEETGARMDDAQVRDEVMTLLLAGHETTANALAWTLSLLATHRDVQAAVGAEARAVLGARGDAAPTMDDAQRLTLTRRVVDEGMRLYPPAWAFERVALADDVIGGFHIPAGTLVGVVTYMLHRNPAYWHDPERFDPDRFAPERSAGRHKHAYLPFGAGPRVCIGNTFAQLEATLVLAAIARRAWVEHASHRLPPPEPSITLRPSGPLRLRIFPAASAGPAAARTGGTRTPETGGASGRA